MAPRAARCGTACLAQQERAAHVHRERLVEGVLGVFGDRPGRALIPALAITTSSRPNRSSAASTAAFTCAESVTSVTAQAALPPSSAAPDFRLRLGDPGQEDAGALGDERARGRHSDGALAAGDDRCLAVESPHGTMLAIEATVGPRHSFDGKCWTQRIAPPAVCLVAVGSLVAIVTAAGLTRFAPARQVDSRGMGGVRPGAGFESPAAMRRRWLAGIFAVSVICAILVAIFSSTTYISSGARWRPAATGSPLAAVLVLAHARPSTWPLACRSSAAWCLPLGWMAAKALEQPEVAVVARSAWTLIHQGSPYADAAVARDHHNPNAYNPYLPVMTLFGLPRAVIGLGALTDPRVWFGLVFLLVFWLALRDGGARHPGRWAILIAAQPGHRLRAGRRRDRRPDGRLPLPRFRPALGRPGPGVPSRARGARARRRRRDEGDRVARGGGGGRAAGGPRR